jgi:hypothetical protein
MAQEKVTRIGRLIAWLGTLVGKPPLAPKEDPPKGTPAKGKLPAREIHKRILLRVMRDISEEYYCAGWIIGLEHYLWTLALRQNTEEGQILLYCAEVCGGWWAWDDDRGENVFVPLPVWKTIYNESEMVESI